MELAVRGTLVLLVTLPLAAFIAALALAQRAGRDRRYTLLLAAIVWGIFLTLLTEVLSYFYFLTSTGLAAGWAVFGLACCWLTWRLGGKREPRQLSPPLEDSEKALLCGLGLLLAIVGLTALLAPPNTWDAMSYHLPRVVLWATNRSVQIFPTADYSQVLFTTWAEFAMLHLYLLWGSDRLVNLVEFASLVGTTVAVSSIAATFGASRFIQIVTAIISATIPEGVLEASGAMNTYVGAFWVTTAAYFVLRWNAQPSWLDLFGFSAAAGLAALTKGTAYVFLPFVLLGCWWIGPPAARRLLVMRLPVAALVPLAINGRQFVRSYRLTGSPLGLPFPDAGPRLHWMSEHFSAAGTFANVIRNISLHLGTPFESLNQTIFSVVTSLIRRSGEDPNDPRVVWQSVNFGLNHLSRTEDYAGNPWHLALIVAAVGLLVLLHKKQPAGLPAYTLGVAAAFVLYSGMLQWQPWGSRHQLAVFVLMAPVVAIAFGNSLSSRAMAAIGFALLVCSSPYALANRLRPLIPGLTGGCLFGLTRNEMYLSDQHEQIRSAYIAAGTEVGKSKCDRIGIDAFVDGPDATFRRDPPSFFVYPLLAMAGSAPAKSFRYLNVTNLTAAYARQDAFAPCLVICLDCAHVPSKWVEYKDWRSSTFDQTVIFETKMPGPQLEPLVLPAPAPGAGKRRS
ncbi:MAG: hypothetical protein WBW81_14725 [Methylocella sp.]